MKGIEPGREIFVSFRFFARRTAMDKNKIGNQTRRWLLVIALWMAGAGAGFSQNMNTNQTEVATLGGGCFWCMEAEFQRVPGVKSITSGFAGGRTANPSYEDVCTGQTGHAEVTQIVFDPQKVSYEKLLDYFWDAHDPTTPNQQGADVGTQYRSIILYSSPAQKAAAEKSKAGAQKNFKSPIVTQIVPLDKFYKAEDYHQNYYNNHGTAPYCQVVIKPKLKKFENKLKEEQH
jgi:peptide-methionine (S)-S-oxide reductase